MVIHVSKICFFLTLRFVEVGVGIDSRRSEVATYVGDEIKLYLVIGRKTSGGDGGASGGGVSG